MIGVIKDFISRNLIPNPQGLTIWDLGCGEGSFCAAFAELGAARVLATDLQNLVPASLLSGGKVTFNQGGLAEAVAAFGENGYVPADVVFMHLMTEHVADLRGFCRSLAGRVKPDAEIFLHHDCYFHPVGHHDHHHLFLDDRTWTIEPQGVPCWETAEKCEASSSHRALAPPFSGQLLRKLLATPTTARIVITTAEAAVGSLVYGDDFNRTFPEIWFRDQLNRLTPKQVRWFVQEAGFSVITEDRSYVMNGPPSDLVAIYGGLDLKTFTYSLRAKKKL